MKNLFDRRYDDDNDMDDYDNRCTMHDIEYCDDCMDGRGEPEQDIDLGDLQASE